MLLDSTRDGDVALLTLRPPEFRNALNTELCKTIHAQTDAAIADGARVIVVTGKARLSVRSRS